MKGGSGNEVDTRKEGRKAKLRKYEEGREEAKMK